MKEKNGLKYLSWMWAWTELKKLFPLSYSTIYETEDGSLVWKDPIGAHVKTAVTVVYEENGELKEKTETEYLPIMDNRNKAIPYENIDSTSVNKSIQRSLTKCIARHGLGSYLYVNEDLPEEEGKVIVLKERIKSIIEKKCALSEKAKAKVKELCILAEKNANPELSDDMLTGSIKNIEDVDILETLQKQLLAVRK